MSASAPGRGPGPDPGGSRLAWVDNLRTLMIVLVVNMHACVTYSHVGSWYRVESPAPTMLATIPFLFWQCYLQSFFMGLLFFLAGVFAHQSVERRGVVSFLRERARRLGLPSLLYMLLLHPFIVYVLLGAPEGPDRPALMALYGRYVASGRILSGNGPMWFALALLGFSAALAAWRAWKPAQAAGRSAPAPVPSGRVLIWFGAGLALSTFGVRLVQPIGTNVLNFQLCFFPQYVAAFVAGVAAAKHGWLVPLARSRAARVAARFALAGGPLLFILLLILGGPPPEEGPNPYVGGWTWSAFSLAAWEQMTGLAIALGLLAWFHNRGNVSGCVATWLSARAFAVYVLHAPVLVGLTPLLRPVAVHPFVGVGVLTVTGLAVSFLVADLAKRLPGLRAIL